MLPQIGFSTHEKSLLAMGWPARPNQSALRALVLIAAGTLLLMVSAKVQVPMWPVPMTMQTLAVLLIGMIYGPRLGAATVAVYLMEGAIGLPVFASGGGFLYLVGPTGGYLVGYLAAALIVGMMAGRGFGRNVWTTAAAMLVGIAVIYAAGVGWLATIVGFDKAIELGLIPFLLGDALKLALACCAMPLAWHVAARRHGS
jgi:biotin transport system substrate-specific component